MPLARFERREFPLLSFEYLAPSESGVRRLSLSVSLSHTHILLLSSACKHFPHCTFSLQVFFCCLLNHTFAVWRSLRSSGRLGAEGALPAAFTVNPEACDSAGTTLMESVLHSQSDSCSHAVTKTASQSKQMRTTIRSQESLFGNGSDNLICTSLMSV